jgi:hypothetical protein
MNSGVDVDIVTLKPEETERHEKETAARVQEQRRDETAAGFLLSLNSNEGKALFAVIEEKLSRRIDELVKDDPEASAYINVLHEIGMKAVLGRAAARRITQRHLKNDDIPGG